MRIYLDMCCYNRQFDNKFSKDILKDFNDVIKIQKEIVGGKVDLVTSFMLHYENYRKKDIRRRDKIDVFLKTYKKIYVGIDCVEDLKILSDKIVSGGIKIKDAYHIASAIFANCDYFITVDKKLTKYFCDEIKIITPGEFVKILEG